MAKLSLKSLPPRGSPVLVICDDLSSFDHEGWIPEGEAVVRETPVVLKIIGFVLGIYRGSLRLAMARSEEGNISTVFMIPVGCIRAVHELTIGKAKWKKPDPKSE